MTSQDDPVVASVARSPAHPLTCSIPFAAATLASALLLFAAQPMAGKRLLPLAGGAPAAWATCLVLFQALLLLGYFAADRLVRVRRLAAQVAIYAAYAAGGVALAATLRPDPAWVELEGPYPALGVAGYLLALIGGPFLVLSATAPLVQRWFAAAGSGNPYVLAAVSNFGSLAGLLMYPFAVEPFAPLADQESAWRWGFAGAVGLVALAGVTACRSARVAPGAIPTTLDDSPPSGRDRLRWLLFAALPSSLLLSVSTHLTTDIAPVPMLWVVPLALYLITFIVVFAWWPPAARRVTARVVPMLLVMLSVTLLTGATEPLALVGAVHLAAFFGVALLCHGELAATRPAPRYLTQFYLLMSLGGVLGGLVNALVAPLVLFPFGYVEYPAAVTLAGLVRPPGQGGRLTRHDFGWLAGFALLALALVLLVPKLPLTAGTEPGSVLLRRVVRGGLMYGIPGAFAFALVWKPVRFALCLGVLFLVGGLDGGDYGELLERERNFFGVVRVTRQAGENGAVFIRMVHGTTLHGQERADEPRPPRPLMYYHRKGPVGSLFDKLPATPGRRVGVVGLGCGAMVAYALPGEEWVFYEIDPAVTRLAQDTRYFHFLSDCRAAWRVEGGDARRRLEQLPDGTLDLLALDAFSSDSIPVHLLTREAFELYARKLAPTGVLALHLSNRYLDLPPVVARTAATLEPPFACRANRDSAIESEKADGKFDSLWAVLARRPADLGALATDRRWEPLSAGPGPAWRDDFSSLLGAWKREEE